MEIRRIITGKLEDGSSGILSNEVSAPVTPAALPGLDFHLMWATEDGGSLPTAQETPYAYWPGSHGTRFLLVTWAPQSEVPEIVGDVDALNAEAEAALPGLMGAFEPDNPGYHTSHSIDYGVCLAGEMWLALDQGQEAQIHPGTCVVQRGTRHIWQNRSDQSATMLFVLAGTDDTAKL